MPRLLLVILITSSSLLNGCAQVATGSAEMTGLSLLHDRRTSDILLKDEQIEINAAIKLNRVDAIRIQCHFNITAYNGKVLATGEAPNAKLRNDIIHILRGLANVKEVHNHITVMPPSSFSSRSNDALITSKVKSELANIRNIPGFDATRVKVITEQGHVYLMGLVHKIEADAATESTRRVNGVKQVIKVFEIIG